MIMKRQRICNGLDVPKAFEMERQYDAVCVFDADNLVHPNFLREMNSRLCKGER